MGRPSIPIVELDYYDGQYIDRYDSIEEFALDHDITSGTIRKSFRSCVIGKIPSKELMYIREVDYKRLFK